MNNFLSRYLQKWKVRLKNVATWALYLGIGMLWIFYREEVTLFLSLATIKVCSTLVKQFQGRAKKHPFKPRWRWSLYLLTVGVYFTGKAPILLLILQVLALHRLIALSLELFKYFRQQQSTAITTIR